MVSLSSITEDGAIYNWSLFKQLHAPRIDLVLSEKDSESNTICANHWCQTFTNKK